MRSYKNLIRRYKNYNSSFLYNPMFFLNRAKDISNVLLWALHQQSPLPDEDDWKPALVVPIFKPGDRNSLPNYIPISLTRVSCKLFEPIIYSPTKNHLKTNVSVFPNQHGFQRERSCELLELVTKLIKVFTHLPELRQYLLTFRKLLTVSRTEDY